MEALSALNGTPLDDVVAKHSDAASRILAAASVVDAAKSRLILCIERAVEDARASFGAVAGELAKATTTFKLQALRGQKYRSLWLEKGLEECDSVIKIIESVARLSRAPVGDLALVLDAVAAIAPLADRLLLPGQSAYTASMIAFLAETRIWIQRSVVVQGGVSPSACIIRSPPSGVLRPGTDLPDPSVNAITVQCIGDDLDRTPIQRLLSGDVDVFIVRPGTGKVVGTASVVIMEGGVVVINVCVPSKDRVSVQVNVAIGGVELPVTVVKVCRMLAGRHVRTLKLSSASTEGRPGPSRANHNSLAVAPDGSWMAIATAVASGDDQLRVYNLPSGDLRAGLPYACGVCASPVGNTLIVGVEYRKVVEVTLTGALIRTLEDGRRMSGIDNIQGVDAVGDTVCVGVSRLGIYLYDYGTGDFRAKVPEAQIPEDSRRSFCYGITISPDGRQIVVSDNTNDLLLAFDAESCQFLCSFADNLPAPRGLCFWPTGDLVFVGNQFVALTAVERYATPRLKFGQDGVNDGNFHYPYDVAHFGGLLYVLDGSSDRVQVFE